MIGYDNLGVIWHQKLHIAILFFCCKVWCMSIHMQSVNVITIELWSQYYDLHNFTTVPVIKLGVCKNGRWVIIHHHTSMTNLQYQSRRMVPSCGLISINFISSEQGHYRCTKSTVIAPFWFSGDGFFEFWESFFYYETEYSPSQRVQVGQTSCMLWLLLHHTSHGWFQA